MRMTKIGEFLKRSKIPINIEDDIEYNRVTIRINHNGVSLRDSEIGKKIGTKKQFILKAGQFIVSKIDARYGAFGIAPDEVEGAIITGNFWAYDVDKKKVNIEWFNQFTNSADFYDICERASSGITHRKYLDEKFFLNYEIYLPNVDEQQIQIEKIKSQKNSFSALSTELTHQLTLVKKLRQQLLQDAVQGKLVEQNPKDEPASELLKKIKAEKQKLIAEKKLKKEKELPTINSDEIPFEIPDNWVWCRLGDLGVFRRGPFGSALTKGIFVKEGFKVYEQRNAIYDNHTLGEYFVTKEKYEELKAFRIFPKDLIVSCSGATLGRIAEIPEDAREGIMNQALMRIKLFNSTITNSYFIRLFRSSFMQKNIFSQAWGSAIPNMVGLVEIKKILIPLPPLEEQNRIVQKLDQLMQYCSELEASIKQSESQNEKLLQQVLREALRKEPVEV